MPLRVQFKRSAVPGKKPTSSDLEYGELAVNYNAASPALYTKDSSNNVIDLGGVKSATATTRGVVQWADAAAITAGTAGRAVDAAQLKAEGFWDRSGTTITARTSGDVARVNLQPLNGHLGCRNLLINANPMVNQRGWTSGKAATAAGDYCLDRWRIITAGQAVGWSDAAGIRTLTVPTGGIEQIVEDACNLGGVHTLSWSGNATATVDGAAVANGGQVTLTPNTNVRVKFFNGTLALPQLEPGPVATPFERRNPALELMLCQRYYLPWTGPVAASPAAGGVYMTIPGLDRLRSLPTLAATAQTAFYFNGTGWVQGIMTAIVVKQAGATRYLEGTGPAGIGQLVPLNVTLGATMNSELI